MDIPRLDLRDVSKRAHARGYSVSDTYMGTPAGLCD
jgi:hypothetical protein